MIRSRAHVGESIDCRIDRSGGNVVVGLRNVQEGTRVLDYYEPIPGLKRGRQIGRDARNAVSTEHNRHAGFKCREIVDHDCQRVPLADLPVHGS